MRSSISDLLHIAVDTNTTYSSHKDKIQTFVPADKSKGATEKEIQKWFGILNMTVLRFTHMVNVFKGFDNSKEGKQFILKVDKAFVKSDYRQKAYLKPKNR